jgi:hypothetical protein
VKESAAKKKDRGSTGHGDLDLARVLGEAAIGTARTGSFLGERYRQIACRTLTHGPGDIEAYRLPDSQYQDRHRAADGSRTGQVAFCSGRPPA